MREERNGRSGDLGFFGGIPTPPQTTGALVPQVTIVSIHPRFDIGTVLLRD